MVQIMDVKLRLLELVLFTLPKTTYDLQEKRLSLKN